MSRKVQAKVLHPDQSSSIDQSLLDMELSMVLLSKELTRLANSCGHITKRLRESRLLLLEQDYSPSTILELA